VADNSPLGEALEALKQFIAGNTTSINEALLASTLQSNQCSIVVGERAVAIGGNVNDAIIITGDGNVVHVFNGLDASTLETIAQLARETLVLPTLLTPEQFSKRVEREALIGHHEVLVGREFLLEKFRQELAGDAQILVLNGPGGIGKTRLLLSLPDYVPSRTKVWFLRTEAESVEHAMAALDRESHLVLVIDDAHRFLPLRHMREVLVNPDFTKKVTVILVTRPVFKKMVMSQLSPLRSDRLSFIEVGALNNADIDSLLQQLPNPIVDERVRHALIRIAEGNPLIAFIAASLVQRNVSLLELTHDQVLTHYLDDMVQDLARADGSRYEDYISYLDVIAALGSIELHNKTLVEQVHQVISLAPLIEERILTNLQTAGLVVRYGTILTIASEVLADHILFRHFFDPQAKHADYHQVIIEPFITLKPKDILKRLATAEIKGDSSEASALLGDLLDIYSQAIKTEGNAGRLQALTLLQDMAYPRSDDMLTIVSNIVDSPALTSESAHYPGWGNFEVSHDMVLIEVIDLLRKTIYGQGLEDSVLYLHKLATYRPTEHTYIAVRDKAKRTLAGIAALAPDKPYTVQLTLLKHVISWIEQDFVGNLDVSIALISPMLSMLWETSDADPTKPSTIRIRWGVPGKDDLLLRIRQQALDLLYKMYPLSIHLIQRLQIVRALGGAIPYARPDLEISPEIKTWLQPDCMKTARFLSETVIPDAELPVLDAVADWLSHATSFGGYQGRDFVQIRQQLHDHNLYQFFRLLIGRSRNDNEEDRFDWKAHEQRRRQKIEEYVEQLSDATITQAIHDVTFIAEQADEARQNSDTYWLDFLLETLGEQHPDFADLLIQKVLTGNSALKKHLHRIFIGLRRCRPDVVATYTSSWVSSDDETLLRSIVLSYAYVEWGKLQKQEWDILSTLVAKSSSQLDWDILSLLPSFSPYRPELAVSFLKEIAARGDTAILRRIADIVVQPNMTNDGWDITIANKQDYLDIFQNFEQLPELDHATQQCMNRLGQFGPMLVIDFLEQRIAHAAKHRLKDKRYRAIPFQFTLPLESIHTSDTYRDVLQRICDWMLRNEAEFFWETPQVLKVIAHTLDEVLCSVLMERVTSGDTKKQEAAARLLRWFNDGQVFYDLSRELIIRTNNKVVLDAIGAAIVSTPLSNLGMFAPSYFHTKRIEELSLWLQDNNFRVRHFAQRQIQHFQKMLEFDEGLDGHRD